MGRLLERYRGSRFHFLYNLQDEKARGRVVLLSTSVVSSLAGTLTSGLFYTTFLITNGIDLVNIGILTFLPYIASCFSVFSPVLPARGDHGIRRHCLHSGYDALYCPAKGLLRVVGGNDHRELRAAMMFIFQPV